MKKNLFFIGILATLFILSGCGSDNISNDKPKVDALEATLSPMQLAGKAFQVKIAFTKKFDSSYQIQLSNFSLTSDSCSLTQVPLFAQQILNLNGVVDSFGSVDVSGTFDDTCLQSGYTFSALQTTTKNGQIDQRMVSVTKTGDDSSVVVVPEPSTGFFNVTTPLQITQSSTGYEIKVQMQVDGYIAVGKEVRMKPFESQYGSVFSYVATTGEDGYAVFNYTSPDTLPTNGTQASVELTHNDNGKIITQEVVLSFQEEENPDKVTALYIVPGDLTITQPGEEREIKILTLNAKHIGVSTTVALQELSDGVNDYGTFSSNGLIQTDESGQALVMYTAPDVINGLSDRTIMITEISQNIEQTFTLTYSPAVGPSINYDIGVEIPASINIEDTNEITVRIHELEDMTKLIDNMNVHQVNVTSLSPSLLTFDGENVESYSAQALKPITVTTNTLSGTAVIKINASIFDGAKEISIEKIVSIPIFSGPVTAMSLVYKGTDEDSDLGLNKNYYTIHAVDKYNNPAKEGVQIFPSIINGTKIVQSPFFGETGEMFTDGATVFQDITKDFSAASVGSSDILAVVPNQLKFSKNYLGNWSITGLLSSTQLQLAEPFFDSNTSGLSYVIGNSQRIMPNDHVATVDIQPRDGTYATDARGNVRLVVTFDPILSGHTVTISANAHDESSRTGIAQINGLRWGNYNGTTQTVSNDLLGTHTVTLQLGISNSSGAPIEYLMGIEIDPTSIMSSSSQCVLDITDPSNDLVTNANGEISFTVKTEGTDPEVSECEISWSGNSGSMYMEY